jgi:hypothetical protein
MYNNKSITITHEIFAPIIRKFPREKIKPLYIDAIWSIDLIDKTNISKYNNNYQFIFTIIDNFSKYACAIPLKNKSGKSTVLALKQVISQGRKPDRIWADQGKEFYNKDILTFLENNSI